MTETSPGATRALARFILDTNFADLPADVQAEGPRAFLNWLGCLYGGLDDPAYDTAFAALARFAGAGPITVIGRNLQCDPISGTFYNALASCTHAYDDTHLPTIAHPTGPAAAAALTVAQMTGCSGAEMLNAMLLGIEVQCRAASAIARAPAKTSIGFYMTGLTGALGAAAAAGKLLGLDEQKLVWALGIASAQGAGFRETHATMSNGLMRAQAARNGMTAALLAQQGFTCSDTAIEGTKGFASVYGQPANLAAITDGLGQHFELRENAYKPYPCAIVIHPSIDVCRELMEVSNVGIDQIVRIDLRVNPRAAQLSGLLAPKDAEEARISLVHWCAAAIVRRRAGLEEGSDSTVNDPAIQQMRARIHAVADESVASEAAFAQMHLADGRRVDVSVLAARGSAKRPLSNQDLAEKFVGQAFPFLSGSRMASIIVACTDLAGTPRAAETLLPLLEPDLGQNRAAAVIH